MLAIGFTALAQPDWDPNVDCDCDPMDDAIVCVIDQDGFTYAMPECFALCLDLDIIEGDCGFDDWEDEGDWEWEDESDCDCDPMDEEMVCVEDEWGVYSFPACLAECLELNIIDGDCDNDWEDEYEWEDEYDCDCDPMDEEMVCVEDEWGVYPFPACLAECLELNVVDGDCEYDWEDEYEWEDESDCDCDPMDEEMVCVEDEWGVYSFPACLAECLELNIIDGDCDNDWEDEYEWEDEYDCDCDPMDEEMVCVEDEWGVYPFPACLAECLGLAIVEGDCDYNDWEDEDGEYDGDCEGDWGDFDCDCDEFDDEVVCVENEFGEVFPVPACIAECLGLAVIDGDCSFDWEDEGDWDNEDDCDCDPADDEMVCVEDEWGVYSFPACLAECLGLNIVDGDCDNDWEDEGDWDDEFDCDCDGSDETLVCVEDEFGIYAFPACLAECLGLNVVDGDCGNGGFDDEDGISGGPNVGLISQSSYTESKGGSLSQVLMYPNPTNKNTTLTFNASKEMSMNIQVTNLSGQVVSSYQYIASEGSQNVDLSLEGLEAGIYLVTLFGGNDAPLALRVSKY